MFEDWSAFMVLAAFFLLISILTLDIITLVNVIHDDNATPPKESINSEHKEQTTEKVQAESKVSDEIRKLASVLSESPSLDTIDVLISLGPKDTDIIKDTVDSLRRHCLYLDKIFIVSSIDPNIDNITWVNETKFPFTKSDLNALYNIPLERCGWYFQQLIKLYAASTIPELKHNYLVWDADTILLRDTSFVCRNRALFSYSDQHHVPYFKHMQKLSPFLTRETRKSGICNYMVFNRWSLKRLFLLVESTNTEPFWKLFLNAVDPEDYVHSGASEFEIYFNYMHKFEPEKFVLRVLECLNNCSDVSTLTKDQRAKYDLASCHWYLRKQASVLGQKF